MTVLEQEDCNNCEGIKSCLEPVTKFKESYEPGMRKDQRSNVAEG